MVFRINMRCAGFSGNSDGEIGKFAAISERIAELKEFFGRIAGKFYKLVSLKLEHGA